MKSGMSESKRMPKTVRPKKVVIAGKQYDKCPYPDCPFMSRDWGYVPGSDYRRIMLDEGEEIAEHIRQVHGYVWRSKGNKAGWWHVSKFHDRSEAPK